LPLTPSDPPEPVLDPVQHRWLWRRTRRLTAVLLLVWFVVSFVLTYHARALDVVFLGWPFSFWLAAQGALLVYLLLVVLYAWAMHRLEARAAAPRP
jgi:putative solute:sodium symporter small subunit